MLHLVYRHLPREGKGEFDAYKLKTTSDRYKEFTETFRILRSISFILFIFSFVRNFVLYSMDVWAETMSAFRENKSYCACVGTKEKKLICSCGEVDYEPAWKWDENAKTSTAVVSQSCQNVYFHKGYSVGNACVRGDTPFTTGNDYYWEVKMLSSVYGTSMMVGIGTENFNINQFNQQFCNLLGCDSESWGMKFDGTLYHNNQIHQYNPVAGFTIGSIVGVHLDMWNGTLEFYLNRIPLGIAFTGLRNKILYPLISSTASHTIMKLIFTHSEPHSLLLMSVKYLNEESLGNLPPGLKSYSKTCWWLFPKSNRLKPDKKFDLLPSLYSVDLLTDSDEEDDNQNSSDCNVLSHRVKRVFENSVPHEVMRSEGVGESPHPHFHSLGRRRTIKIGRHRYRPWMNS